MADSKPRGTGHAKHPRAGEAKESPARREAREDSNAAETRTDAVEAFLKAHPEKRVQRRGPAPYTHGEDLEAGEDDRRAVFQALGHDTDGKCPAGVDWRTRGEQPAKFCALPEDAQKANWAASLRASSYLNHLGVTTAEAYAQKAAAVAPCGWWFCGQSLKADQWADLLAAVEILRASGRDPNGFVLAYWAATYAQNVAWAIEWPTWKDLRAFIEKNPNLPASTIDGGAISRLQAVEWAKRPSGGRGQPVDAPYHRFLNEYPAGPSAEWTPSVAGAILFLFGLADKERLADEKQRASREWNRGGELSKRR